MHRVPGYSVVILLYVFLLQMDVNTIINHVSRHLSTARTNECTLATTLLVVGVCYFMAQGIHVKYDKEDVVEVKTVVGNVTIKHPDGTRVTRGHWWVRLRTQTKKHDIDLTAKQFYPKLPFIYTGNPESYPLCASIDGTEVDSGIECGETTHDPSEYADQNKVLTIFSENKPEMVAHISQLYGSLSQHM